MAAANPVVNETIARLLNPRPAASLREREQILGRLRRMTRLLDTSLGIPGTKIRFGLDPLLGLIPGGGDLVSLLMSGYVLHQARRLGLPRHLMTRMIMNVGIDAVAGAVPLVGDLFDVAFKANVRNMKLIEEHLHQKG
jgi:hypothetical protein